jgi:CDP-diacylglycerol--glycerol-3-phosphate 3-phosphatidyltransferase
VNLANVITVARMGLVPPLIVLLLEGDQSAAALAVFVIAALSDMLDGYIARSRNLVTTFGKLMDPLADKLLIGAAFICLAAIGQVAPWIVGVILSRELAVSALRWLAKRDGVVIAASSLGKAKTAVQSVAVVTLIVVANPTADWVELILATTVAITVVSGCSYFLDYRAATRPAVAG